MKVAVIIPAYNEEDRIGQVLSAVVEAQFVDEIIVVNDGSCDNTSAKVASFSGIRLIEVPSNRGKAAAMCLGVRATDAEVIAFVDADLEGLHSEHIDQILEPILTKRAEMCIGVFRGGKFWSTAAQKISPYISGQRAMRRYIFESIPYLSEMRMGVEVAINTWAKRLKARVVRVVISGVSNTYKEKKMGIMRGTAARAKMYGEIGRAMVRMRRKAARKSVSR